METTTVTTNNTTIIAITRKGYGNKTYCLSCTGSLFGEKNLRAIVRGGLVSGFTAHTTHAGYCERCKLQF